MHRHVCLLESNFPFTTKAHVTGKNGARIEADAKLSISSFLPPPTASRSLLIQLLHAGRSRQPAVPISMTTARPLILDAAGRWVNVIAEYGIKSAPATAADHPLL